MSYTLAAPSSIKRMERNQKQFVVPSQDYLSSKLNRGKEKDLMLKYFIKRAEI